MLTLDAPQPPKADRPLRDRPALPRAACQGLTVKCKVHFRVGRKARKKLEVGDPPPAPETLVEPGRVLRGAPAPRDSQFEAGAVLVC